MPASTWIIREMESDGRGGYIDKADGEAFLWSSSPSFNSGLGGGGARSAPKKPWPIPQKVRTVRTDYPGSKRPSEQVLGPNFEPFTLTGRWDDRYNFVGYAKRELARFEAMVWRCNIVRFTFEEQEFLGLITDFTPDYRHGADIRYTFTVSNHGRPGALAILAAGPVQGGNEATVSPRNVTSAPQAIDEAQINALAIANAQAEMSATSLNSTIFGQLADRVEAVNVMMDNLNDSLQQRILRPITTPIKEFKRLGSQFRIMQGNAAALVEDLVGVRSDTELAINTAMSVLDFESWSRTMRFYGRLLIGNASKSAKAMDERDEPSVQAVYQPFAGESLYSISRRFFGTPFAANLIAEQNRLTSFVMAGDETLLIPERGAS